MVNKYDKIHDVQEKFYGTPDSEKLGSQDKFEKGDRGQDHGTRGNTHKGPNENKDGQNLGDIVLEVEKNRKEHAEEDVSEAMNEFAFGSDRKDDDVDSNDKFNSEPEWKKYGSVGYEDRYDETDNTKTESEKSLEKELEERLRKSIKQWTEAKNLYENFNNLFFSAIRNLREVDFLLVYKGEELIVRQSEMDRYRELYTSYSYDSRRGALSRETFEIFLEELRVGITPSYFEKGMVERQIREQMELVGRGPDDIVQDSNGNENWEDPDGNEDRERENKEEASDSKREKYFGSDNKRRTGI